MRIHLLAGALSLACGALAWDQFDYEIFDLVSALEASEGKGASFYSFLNVTPTATSADISRQYRKRSLELHPDKNPDIKNAQERFARLGVIANILRNDEQRERYDYFYKAGVPMWRGSGYYYSRYRPGIILVVIGLALASCGLQYLVQRLNFFLAKQRLDNFRRRAVKQAYGDNPGSKARDQRRLRLRLPKSELPEDRNNVFLIAVHGEDVYLIDEDTKQEHLLDDAQLPRAGLLLTWLPSLLLSLIPNREVKAATGDDIPSIEIEPATDPISPPSEQVEVNHTQSTTRKRKGGKR